MRNRFRRPHRTRRQRSRRFPICFNSYRDMLILFLSKSRNGEMGEPYYTMICRSPTLDSFLPNVAGFRYLITFTSKDDRTIDVSSVRCTCLKQPTINFKAEEIVKLIQHNIDRIRIKNQYNKIGNITFADYDQMDQQLPERKTKET